MPDSESAKRGSYAKGRAKREEILTRALEVIAREGYRGASVKELADAVGLSQAGLLHYFDSKEQLFTEIIRKRDEVDSVQFGSTPSAGIDYATFRDGYVALVGHNSEVPGLVHLFSRLSVDAVDPEHPAHAFFLERGELIRGVLTDIVATAQREGSITDRIAPETAARVLQAVADGMQLQWMVDPTVDMAATVGALLDVLAPDAGAR